MNKPVTMTICLLIILLVLAACNKSDGLTGRTISIYSTSVGDIIDFGGYKWRVLEVTGSRALVLSENVLEMRPYNSYQDVTWESCYLRSYLNGSFYNSFTSAERERIVESRIINADNPWYGTSGGVDTVDMVFLLSLDEVVRYFGDSGQLRSGGNGYFSDQYNSARIATYNDEATWWWLRSPGSDSYSAAHVLDGGQVDVDGSPVHGDHGGVRPALWLNQ